MPKNLVFFVLSSVAVGFTNSMVNHLVGYHAAQDVSVVADATHNVTTFVTGCVWALAWHKWVG